MNKISFIGLGKLGLPLASHFAKSGIEVIAIDKNEILVNKLNNGEVPFFEPGLEEHLIGARNNIKYQTTQEGFENTDITIILVITPNNPIHGPFSMFRLFLQSKIFVKLLRKQIRKIITLFLVVR